MSTTTKSLGVRTLHALEQLLLPATCVLCGTACELGLGTQRHAVVDLCDRCIRDLPANSSACAQCGEQLTGKSETDICGACLRRPPRFQSTYCAFRYSYPVDHLVRALKYRGRLAYARVLGTLLAQSLADKRTAAWPNCLLPVPLALSRFQERGFNQAIELCSELEKHLRIPMNCGALIRERATSEQAGLDRIGRRKNVRNAFAISQDLSANHVAIVDDVITTGSTVNEIARMLRRAGVERIEVWAVARASR